MEKILQKNCFIALSKQTRKPMPMRFVFLLHPTSISLPVRSMYIGYILDMYVHLSLLFLLCSMSNFLGRVFGGEGVAYRDEKASVGAAASFHPLGLFMEC